MEKRADAERVLRDTMTQRAADRAAFLQRACAEDPELRSAIEDVVFARGGAQVDDVKLSDVEMPARGQTDLWADLRALLRPGDPASRDSATVAAAPCSEPVFSTPPPDSFAGYQIVKEIHRVGQGVVYQAVQKSTKRKVAIKVMKEGPFAGRADRARFEREVEILGQLSHPSIVAVHDSGSAAGCFYFVMDYISGQPLDVWEASGHRSIDETMRLFAKICDAVNSAHLRGVIHRDLKPGNIRVDDAGEPHILDFGLAKVTHGAEEASLMTMTGQFMGSLPWASPEQAEAKPGKIDVRTDVYSLGVILYQMLTGKFPYEVVGNMRDVLDRIMKAEPVRPSTVHKQINDEVETIVLKCLAKERERRYQSAGELGRDIGHYLKGEAIEAKRDSALYVLSKQLRRYKGPVVVGAAFVVLLVLATALSTALYFHAAAAEQAQARERQRADVERIRSETSLVAEEEQRRLAETAQATANEHRVRAEEYAESLTIQLDRHRIKGLLRDAGAFTGAQAPDRARRALLEALDIAQRHPDENCELVDKVLERLGASYCDSAEWALAAEQYESLVALRRCNLIADWQLCFWSWAPGSTIIQDHEHWAKIIGAQPLARLDSTELAFDWSGAPARGVPDEYFATVAETRTHVPTGRYHIACLADDAIRVFVNGALVTDEFRWYPTAVDSSALVLIEDGNLSVRVEHANCGGRAQLWVWIWRGEAGASPPEGSPRRFGAGVAHALARLASVRDELGNVEARDAALQEALAIYWNDRGCRNTAWVQAAHDLANVQTRLGDHAAVESLYRALLDSQRRIFGDESPSVVDTLDSIGWALARERDYAAAESWFREELSLRHKLRGSEHVELTNTLSNLGYVCWARDDLAAAESWFREGLGLRRKLLGDEDPRVADTLCNLASVLCEEGNWVAAEPLFREGLAIRQKKLPAADPATAFARAGLASTLTKVAGHTSADLNNRDAKLAEAETLLLAAFDAANVQTKTDLRRVVLEAFVELYDTWSVLNPDREHAAKAALWRTELARWHASTEPAATQSSPATGTDAP